MLTLRRQIATSDCHSDMPAYPIERSVSHLGYRADIRSGGQSDACGDQRLAAVRRERELRKHRTPVFIRDNVDMVYLRGAGYRQARLYRDGHITAVFGDQRQLQLDFAFARAERPIAKEPLKGCVHRLVGQRHPGRSALRPRIWFEPNIGNDRAYKAHDCAQENSPTNRKLGFEQFPNEHKKKTQVGLNLINPVDSINPRVPSTGRIENIELA